MPSGSPCSRGPVLRRTRNPAAIRRFWGTRSACRRCSRRCCGPVTRVLEGAARRGRPWAGRTPRSALEASASCRARCRPKSSVSGVGIAHNGDTSRPSTTRQVTPVGSRPRIDGPLSPTSRSRSCLRVRCLRAPASPRAARSGSPMWRRSTNRSACGRSGSTIPGAAAGPADTRHRVRGGCTRRLSAAGGAGRRHLREGSGFERFFGEAPGTYWRFGVGPGARAIRGSTGAGKPATARIA